MLAAATAVSASAFAGVVGPAGALVPILAGLGTVGGAAAVGMQGMGETLEAISEEFATAALDGRVFNLAAEDIQDALAAPHVSPRCTPNHGGQAIVPARTRVPRADALPKSVQPTAKKMLVEIRDAEDRDHAVEAAKRFDAEFRCKWPKAADKISGDLDRLLTLYDLPAEHWLHLKTSNPIESTFSTVRLRTKRDQGTRLTSGRLGDGVQADRVRRSPLMGRQRAAPRRPRSRRCRVPEEGADREQLRRGPGRRFRSTGRGHRVVLPRVTHGTISSTTLDYSSRR